MTISFENIKAIIWDWNGTLLNDVDICIDCINKVLAKRRKKLLDKELYLEIFTFPVKDYYEAAGFDFSKEEFDVPAMEFINEYYQAIDNANLHDEVIDVLNHFKTNGFKQYVLSAMEHENLLKSMKEKGIYDYFIHINGIDNHYAHSKVEMGESLIKQINLKPDEILMIGDTLHDMEVAEALGINCLLIANGHQSKQRLMLETNSVINDLSELSGHFDYS